MGKSYYEESLIDSIQKKKKRLEKIEIKLSKIELKKNKNQW